MADPFHRPPGDAEFEDQQTGADSLTSNSLANRPPDKLEMERCSMEVESVIVSDPEILGGTPCFRGTRVPVDSLIHYLEAGDTLDEFLDNFPSVTREAAIAALEEAKALLTSPR